MNLGSLDGFNKKKKFHPSVIAVFQHFFLKQGVTLDKFQELPIPYIIEMANTEAHFNDKERAALDKAKAGK